MYAFFLTSNGIACHATNVRSKPNRACNYSYRDKIIRLMRIGEYHQNVTFSHGNYYHIIICVQ